MAEEHRRVVADTEIHARALADNLVNQGYAIVEQRPEQWTLRKARRRGDHLVTIAIARPWSPGRQPPGAPPVSPAWGPPTGPAAR